MCNSEKNCQLVAALKQGDESAFTALFTSYSRLLFAYALSLSRDHAMAQDILQNVYLKIWKFRSNLNPKLSIRSFLFKAVYNEFINQYKQKKTISILEQKYMDALNKMYAQSEDVIQKQQIEFINSEIEKLPSKCKLIFKMSKKEGLSNQEISKYLGVSIKTVEGHITNAFRRLKAKLPQRSKLNN